MEEVRLNKYLSDAGICSRREADRKIEEGRVTIDGRKAGIGEKVIPGAQKILLDSQPVLLKEKTVLIAFHKPVGIICTADHREPDNIIDFIGFPTRIFPVGRLDKDSEGLILLTNDGELMNEVLKGRNEHEKEYLVTVNKPVTDELIQSLQNGVQITLESRGKAKKDGSWIQRKKTVMTRPCTVSAAGEREFKIILTQGLNRQIRKMCETQGFRVLRLKRLRILNIELGRLKAGTWRNVTSDETAELKRLLTQIEENNTAAAERR